MSKEVLPRPMVLEEFAPHVRKAFHAECSPKNAELVLVEAKPLTNHARLERPPFSLLFHSDPAVLLTSGVYTIRCDGLEPAAVYLEPTIAPPGGEPGYFYQAIFN